MANISEVVGRRFEEYLGPISAVTVAEPVATSYEAEAFNAGWDSAVTHLMSLVPYMAEELSVAGRVHLLGVLTEARTDQG